MFCDIILVIHMLLVYASAVDALQRVVTRMGSTHWKFDADSCRIEMVGLTPKPPNAADSDINCDCNIENTTDCHIIKMYSFLNS